MTIPVSNLHNQVDVVDPEALIACCHEPLIDIRVPSRQDLMAGRNIKIIELNGVTSEATHIYDPKLSLFEAYRVLFRQWRTAFEIGDLNRARGIHPASVADLLAAARQYSRLAQSYPE